MALHSTLLILKAELRQMINGSVGKGPRRSKLLKLLKGWSGYLVLLAVAVGIGRGVYGFAAGMNATLADYSDIARLIWVNLLSSISLGVFIMLFMTGISVVFQSMFEAGDVKFLLSTPMPAGSIVGAKLTMSAITNLMTVAPFLYPIWAGWGAASGAPVSFYVLSFIAMLLAVILFNAIVAMLVMVIMRYVGSAKMRQVILVGSLVLGFIVFAVFQVFSSTMARNNGSINYADVAQMAQGLNMSSQSWSPHIWMLKSSLLTMPGYGYSVWTSLVPLAVSALLATMAAVALARHAFVVGWSNAKESASSKGKRGVPLAPGSVRTLISRHDGAGWAIFARDLTMVLRQPVLWYGMLVAIVGSAFFVYNISSPTGASNEREAVMKAMIMMMLTMMSAVATGQFSGIAVSLDGEALWLMKAAPISPATYYGAKLAFATAPGAIVLTLLLVGVSFVARIPQYPLYLSLPVGIAMLSALAAMMVMTDAIKPNFNIRLSGVGQQNKQDPVKAMVSTFGSMLGSVAMGAVFLFNAYYGELRWFSGWTGTAAMVFSLTVTAVIIGVAHLIAGRVAVRRVRALFRGSGK